MAVPTQLSDLSATASANSPAGTDSVGTTMDDYLRAIQSIIARIAAGTDALTLLKIGDTTSPAGRTILNAMLSNDTANGANMVVRKCVSSASNGPNITQIRGRGTSTVPTVVQADDNIGADGCYGYDGTNYTLAAQFIGFVDGTVSAGIVPGRIELRTADTSGVSAAGLVVDSNRIVYLGGTISAPAFKAIPVASQTRCIEAIGSAGGNPTIGANAGNLAFTSVVIPLQATTGTAPTYVKGGIYFDTTLNKLRVGGATAWETITSS